MKGLDFEQAEHIARNAPRVGERNRWGWFEGYWHALAFELGERRADEILDEAYRIERRLFPLMFEEAGL